MIRQFSGILNLARPFLDVLFHCMAFVSAVYYAGIRVDSIPYGLWPELLLMSAIYGICYKYFGLYGIQRVQSLLFIDYNIVKASSMAILVFNIACLLARIAVSPKELVYFFFIDILYLITFRMLFTLSLHQLRRKGHNVRYVLVVGAGSLGLQLYDKIEEMAWTGLKVIGFLDDNIPSGTAIRKSRILGTIHDIRKVMTQFPVDQIFICLPMRAFKRIEELMLHVGEELAMIRIIPDIYQYPLFLKSSISMLDDVPIITLNDTLFHGWRRVCKRVIDISMSFVALCLLSPLMAVIAVVIKLTSPGPVFFKQERVGFSGRRFNMLKFRSMAQSDQPETALLTPKDDARVTKIGSLIRRTSLDELPQFLNVLLGNMSIVGPRPERTWVVNSVRDKIPGYMLKHKMKAGITGWAQINGWRGDTSLERRIEHDLYYIENWSLLFDLKIMFLTAFKGLMGKNAY